MGDRRRIGMDCLYADPGRTAGTWVYAISLLRELSELDGDTEYLVFLSSRAAEEFPLQRANIRLIPSRMAGHSVPARILFQNSVLPLLTATYGVHLLHSLGNYGPLAPTVRSLVTVHDLLPFFDATLRANGSFSRRAAGLGFLMEQSLRRAAGVIANSEYTRRELLARFPFVAGKVRVIYPGLPSFRREAPLDFEGVLADYRISGPYLLAVGLFPPHKNIPRLMEAFARVHPKLRVRYQLVLVGNLGAEEPVLRRAAAESGVEPDMRFTGFVPEEKMAALYSGAALLVYPSLREGFGLPVLEAVANRVPVACSNAGPLPEVAGEAAILFDPLDVEDMARAIRQGLEDGALRLRLVAKGLEQVERFSFGEAARATLQFYDEILHGKARGEECAHVGNRPRL